MVVTIIARLGLVRRTASVSPKASEDLEHEVTELRNEFARLAEAGVSVPYEIWNSWETVIQNLWLEERQTVEHKRIALLARTLTEDLQGGTLAEDMVWEDLPESARDELMQERVEMKRYQEDFLRKLTNG